MRIIAGRWRGRTIDAPPGLDVRPTADRAREAWMSRLHAELPGARVLDLFAGSGALGLEALSRGAAFCDFVETAPRSLEAIRANAERLGALPNMALHRVDVLRFVEGLAPRSFDVAFADPPYSKGLAPALVRAWLGCPFSHILSVEHHIDEELPEGGTSRRYGTSVITVYRDPDPDDAVRTPAG